MSDLSGDSGRIQQARFWAKTTERADTYHPLVAHAADVAAVLRAGTEPGTALHDRIARAAGPKADLDVLRSLMLYLATLHDLGKANHGFQDKAGPWARRARKWTARGHVIPVVGSINAAGPFQSTVGRLVRILPLDRPSAQDAFLTAIAHHGRPWTSDPAGRAAPLWASLWAPDSVSGRAPLEEIDRLGRLAAAWSGLRPDHDPLPWTPALSNLFAGLLTVSDWIASTEEIFTFAPEADDEPNEYWERTCETAAHAVRQVGLRPSEVAQLSGDVVYPRLFPTVFPEHVPTPLQRLLVALELPAPGTRLVIESETGSGKTEAALALYARLRAAGRVDGLVFALPTRATAKAMYDRIRNALPRLHPEGVFPTVALAMGGEIVEATATGDQVLAPDLWPDQEDRILHRWSSENHKRFFAAEIVIGTVDQLLLAGLPVKHAHMRLALLTRHLIVVDEVHSYDRYMNAILNRVVDYHASLGGVAAFLSATLSREARNRLVGSEADLSLEEASRAPYPSVSIHQPNSGEWRQIHAAPTGRSKEVAWSIASQQAREATVFDEAIRAAEVGGRVCILRNTVKEARATVETLADRAPEYLWRPPGSDRPTAYHSRYIPGDRLRIDTAVLADFGKASTRQGVILVATQVVEQSLDVDFDWMMTDLAPVDVLLQRIGRLHRHRRSARPAGLRNAHLAVQAPEEPFPPRKTGHGPFGWGTVYEDWADLELTRRLITDRPQVVIPRDNRLLVEAVYHPDARQAFIERAPEWERAIDAAQGRGLGLASSGAMSALELTIGYSRQAHQYDASLGDQIRTRIGDDRISVALDSPVKGWYDRDATADEVPLRLEQLQRAGLEDFNGATAILEAESAYGPIYRLGEKLRLRYGPEGWMELG